MKKLITLLLVLTGMVSTAMGTNATVYVKADNAPMFYVWNTGDGGTSFAWEDKPTMSSTTLNGTTVYKYDIVYYGDTYDFKFITSSGIESGNVTGVSGDVYYYWDETTNTPTYRGINQVVSGSRQITAGNVEWSSSSSDNKMTTTDDETFTLTVTGQVLKGGETYSYKICADGGKAWVPSDNQTLSVPDDGVYDITYTYVRYPFSVTAVATKKSAATVSYKYYVWDNGMKISGKAWEDNEMTIDGSTASLSFDDVNLAVGTYKYKIVEKMFKTVDASTEAVYTYWPYNSTDPAGDLSGAWVYQPVFSTSYDVTFSYNISTATPTCSGTADKTGYFLVKEASPNWLASARLTETSSNVWTCTISDWAGKYFAIVPGSDVTDDGTFSWDNAVRPSGDNDKTLGFENYSNQATGGSKSWKVDSEFYGSFDFTYDDNDGQKKWSATPYYEREITNGYATFSSNHNVAIPSGVTAYYATEATIGSVTMTSISNGIPSTQGVFLKADNGTYKFTPAASVESSVSPNKLVKGTASGVAASTGSAYNYVFASQDDELGFFQVDADIDTDMTGRAYLQTDSNIKPVSARVAIIFEDDNTTGVNEMKAQKTEATGIFNLAGQRVAQPTKGLYIVNGKKVMVK